jgi:signal transduction histidine kinase
MSRIEKTAFISYRRKDIFVAHTVYQNLTMHGYDVFFDYLSMGSGDFEQLILGNIRSRSHFVLILTPETLEKCSNPNDWLRLEIQTALNERRNIIPLMFFDFDFYAPNVRQVLIESNLERLAYYNGWRVDAQNIEGAMEIVRNRFLNIPLEGVLHPRSDKAEQAATELKASLNDLYAQMKMEENLILSSMSWLTEAHSRRQRLLNIRVSLEEISDDLEIISRNNLRKRDINVVIKEMNKVRQAVADLEVKDLYVTPPKEEKVLIKDFVDIFFNKIKPYTRFINLHVKNDLDENGRYSNYLLVIDNHLVISGAFLSIVNNAIVVMEDLKYDERKLNIEFKIDIEHGQEYLRSTISNNGPAIPPDILPKLGNSIIEKSGRQSFGAYLTNMAIKRYGGKFEVKSEEGKGTQIVVMLPIFKT